MSIFYDGLVDVEPHLPTILKVDGRKNMVQNLLQNN